MATSKSITEASLQEMAAKYPEKVGTYDPKKKELKTTDGTSIPLKLRKFGKSKAAYVSGKVKEFLVGLNLPELAGTKATESGVNGSGGERDVSLSDVPDHQVIARRSWGAWLKKNPTVDPETICTAINQGYADSEADIKKSRQRLIVAKTKTLEDRARKALKAMKKDLPPARIVELMNEK